MPLTDDDMGDADAASSDAASSSSEAEELTVDDLFEAIEAFDETRALQILAGWVDIECDIEELIDLAAANGLEETLEELLSRYECQDRKGYDTEDPYALEPKGGRALHWFCAKLSVAAMVSILDGDPAVAKLKSSATGQRSELIAEGQRSLYQDYSVQVDGVIIDLTDDDIQFKSCSAQFQPRGCNIKDGYDRTPLFYLVLQGDVAATKTYLSYQPAIVLCDTFGFNLLYYSVMQNNVELTKLLLDYIVEHYDEFTAKWLLNQTFENGQSILHIAYLNGYREIFQLLVECPLVDINHQDVSSRSVLQYAGRSNDIATLRLLQKRKDLDYSLLVKDSGDKKHKQDVYDHILEVDPEFAIAVNAIFAIEREAGIERSDESDEGETVGHTAVVRGKHAALRAVSADSSFPQRARDAAGKTVLNRAKSQGDSKALQRLRARQTEHGHDSSSGSSSSSSSDSDASSSVGAPIPDLQDEYAGLHEDAKLMQSLHEFNTHVGSGKALAEGSREEFVIAHFRGINFNRGFFPHKELREFLQEEHVGRSLYSTLVHNNTDIPFGNETRTEDDESRLAAFAEKIKQLWRELFDMEFRIEDWWKKSRKGSYSGHFSRPSYLIQDRYTNQASKNYQNGQQGDIWLEIWEYIQAKFPELLSEKPHLQPLVDEVNFTGSLFISCGKTPEHAVSYAVGSSLSDINRLMRADPRYRRDGKPKYKHIGMVYVVMHTVPEYLQAATSDVARLHKQGEISIRPNYLNETEVAFIGGIDGRHIVAAVPITFPDFSCDYDADYHLQRFGLSEEQYEDYKDGFKATQKPLRLHLDLLQFPYKAKYARQLGITVEAFALYQSLYKLIQGDAAVTLAVFNQHQALFKPKQLRDLRRAIGTGEADIKAILIGELRVNFEGQLLNVFNGLYRASYKKTLGLDNKTFFAFKRAIVLLKSDKDITLEDLERIKIIFTAKKLRKYKSTLQKGHKINKPGMKTTVLNQFRSIHPYRKLKIKLRNHLSGFLDAQQKKGVHGFYAKQLLNEARAAANRQGKVLVYQDADGDFKLFSETSWATKGKIVSNAKKHAAVTAPADEKKDEVPRGAAGKRERSDDEAELEKADASAAGEVKSKPRKRARHKRRQQTMGTGRSRHSLFTGEAAAIAASRISAEKQGNIGPRTIEGWILQDVEGKGNCFYDAVALQLHMLKHPFLAKVPAGTLERDSLRLRVQDREFRDEEYADHQEIWKLTKELNVIVAIVDTRNPTLGYQYYFVNAEGDIEQSNTQPDLLGIPIIKLAFTGNHYLSVKADPILQTNDALTPAANCADGIGGARLG